jgi:hypothetical protein
VLSTTARHRRRRAVAALCAGAVFGLGLGWMLNGAGSAGGGAAVAAAPSARTPHPAPVHHGSASPRAADTPAPGRTALATALADGVRRAAALGGTAEGAVVADGWSHPVTAGDATRRIRMWSASKPVTAVAALQAAHGRPVPAPLTAAMTAAITRSENCPQRRVVVGLQTLTGGPEPARTALLAVLRQAGVGDARITHQAPAPDPECLPYLRSSGLADPSAIALTLGVSQWTVGDAARFALALGEGRYGAAGSRVLALMRRPKRASTELASADEYTVDAAWGAGRALAGLRPAYKAGWGGATQHRFLAEQLAVVHVGGHTVAVAVAFHPTAQPDVDDPGRTVAPQAIETMLAAVRAQLDSVRR